MLIAKNDVMKKNILILSTIISSIGFLAFGCMSFTEPAEQEKSDFMFRIESRDFETVSLENLSKATSAVDIVLKPADWSRHPVQTMKVTIFENDKEITAIGDGLTFTEEQKKLLGSLDYSDSFNLRAQCMGKNPDAEEMEEYEMNKPFTVIPEKPAVYPGGIEAIFSYLRDECGEEISATQLDKLDPGFIVFTINTSGQIEEAEHLISSGYSEIDNKLVELMMRLPQSWEPAKNSKGEKVEQELALRFGDLSGC